MPGTLYVVATPIGNLEDITLRALRVLREVDLIAAEDTRRTAGLLAKYAISTPTISFHEHNTRTRLPRLIARLKSGESMALVSDAGTPGMSDPGVELVDACVKAAIAVDPIPGVSAGVAAAVASGFPLVPLSLWGFPPRKSHDRTRWLSAISEVDSTLIFFESPHRVAATLRACADILGNRPMLVARELTKVHQELLRGTAAELSARLSAAVKGEITIVIGPLTNSNNSNAVIDDDAVVSVFARQAGSSATRRAAISATAAELGISPKAVYAAVERLKNR